MFALATLPLLGLSGVALDYSRASDIRSRLQAAADAGALAAASHPTSIQADPESREQPEARNAALAVFDANLSGVSDTFNISRTYRRDGSRHIVTATADVKTTVAAVIGQKTMSIGADATAVRSGTGSANPAEIVLAVDATNSMALDGCWCDVVAGVTAILSEWQGCAPANSVSISFLPFSDRINVGTDKASWSSVVPLPSDWRGCFEPRERNRAGNPYALDDMRPTAPPHRFAPTASGYTLSSYDHCPSSRIVGPTTDVSLISAAFASVSPGGSGRYDEALAWAWRLLSPDWAGLWGPANYPARNGTDKVVIFISDGRTQVYSQEVGGPAGGGFGYNRGSRMGFENMVAVCQDMKKQGIEINMVLTKNPNPDFVSYAEACATSKQHFFRLDTTAQLTAALKKISESRTGVTTIARLER